MVERRCRPLLQLDTSDWDAVIRNSGSERRTGSCILDNSHGAFKRRGHAYQCCAFPACGAQESAYSEFAYCGKCRRVVYCCREHQAADWELHKEPCRLIARYASAGTSACKRVSDAVVLIASIRIASQVDPPLVSACLDRLSTLCRRGDSSGHHAKEQLLKHLDLILTLLETENHPEIVLWSTVMLLATLQCGTDETDQRIALACEPTFRLRSTYRKVVLVMEQVVKTDQWTRAALAACIFFHCVTTGIDDGVSERKERAAAANAIEMILDVLLIFQHHAVDARELHASGSHYLELMGMQAFKALRTLITGTGDPHDAVTIRLATRAANGGLADNVVHAIRGLSFSVDAVLGGWLLIRCFINVAYQFEPSAQQQCIDAGAINVIQDTLCQHPTADSLHVAALRTLKRLDASYDTSLKIFQSANLELAEILSRASRERDPLLVLGDEDLGEEQDQENQSQAGVPESGAWPLRERTPTL